MGSFGVPPVRVEDMRIFVELGVVHESDDVGADEHIGWDGIGTNFGLFPCDSGQNASGWGPHSKTLIHEVGHILKFLNKGQIT